MSKKTTVKHIALTIACAAVLAACGGGGSGSTSTDLVDNAIAARNVMNMIEALDEAAEITLEDKASVEAAAQSYNRLSDSQKSLIGKDLKDKLQEALNALAAASAAGTSTDGGSTVDTAEISDNDSLASLNLPTPLHTSFISSSAAQQNNPHMQLRTVDGEPALVDTQIGLIRTLVLNQNDAVVLDGVVLTNSAKDSPATEVAYLTPHSAIVKASSVGTTQEDISEMYGEERGIYSKIKTTLDEGIKTAKTKIDEAQKIIDDPESDEKAKAEAQAVIDKQTPLYKSDLAARGTLENTVDNALGNLAYFKKDKNGLVFDKKFDGVYMIQFADGTRITLHDPAAAGWTYQTFAHYIDPKNGITHGYQSIGDETAVSAMPTGGTATYTGITTAYLVEAGQADRQLTADVKAVADFAKKGLRFETSNAQFHTLNNGVRESEAASGYNMKGSASWAANSNSFTGTAATADNQMTGRLLGKFYGAQAAEIGGTYGLQNAGNTKQLIGGYGAKRP